MVTHTQKLKRRYRITQLPATITLAGHLFRETWGLLLITLCCMVACVGLVCAVPLFSQIAVQIGIQDITKQVASQTLMTDMVASDHPTTTQIQQAGHTIDQYFQAHFSSYLGGSAQFALATPKLQLLDIQTNKALTDQYVSVFGYDPTQLSQQFTVIKGRLPQTKPITNEVEVAITQPVADQLGLQVGTLQQVRYPIVAGSTVWHLHVVGIVATRPSIGNIWHTFDASNTGIDASSMTDDIVASLPAIMPQVSAIQVVQQNTSVGNINRSPTTAGVLAQKPTSTVLASSTLAQKTPTRLLKSSSANSGGPTANAQFLLYWDYPLNLAHINIGNLSSFLSQYDFIAGSTYNLIQDRHVLYQGMQPQLSPAITQLRSYHTKLTYEQIVVILLLISIMGLALFIVSILSNVLVERQLPAIAMLRSRGATLRHIFGSFTLQSLCVGLLALLLGPACAIFLVGFVGQSLLPATAPAAFSVVASILPNTIPQIWIFALFTVVVAFIVMLVSLRRASQIDMVTLRQSTSRQQRGPLWKRLYVDFFLLVIVIIGIGYYQLLDRTDVGTRITLAPLAFLAVPVLSLAIILFFLRFSPLLTRIGTRLAIKSKPAPSVLAFAQMERQPHATLRMIMLLALALSSSVYLLTFIATQQYRVQQVIDYQTGADFSGAITATNPKQTLKDLQAHYASVPGVTAATLGFHDASGSSQGLPAPSIMAINADTYAQTAVWSSAYTTQTLQSLTDQLVSHRTSAIAHNQVYVITTTDLWDALGLYPGKTFTMPTDNKFVQNIQFVALAEANYLPQTQISNISYDSNLLFDYQNFDAVYAQTHQGQQVQPNYVWLHTQDDAHSLSQVRQALPHLLDRRAMIEQLETSPLQVAIEGTIILGLIAAFVLVLIGIGVTAWLSVKQRRMSFAILHALGMSSGQISQILCWEQGITYLSAILIGLGVGWVSTLMVTPMFSLMDDFSESLGVSFVNISLSLPKIAPLPFTWIGLMLGIFVIICAITLLMMSRYGARPVASQVLRLNED
jgi:ABC-type antimicrobial peptide transport system permease subunit